MTEPGAGGAQPPDFGSAGNIIQGQPPVAVLALSQPGGGADYAYQLLHALPPRFSDLPPS